MNIADIIQTRTSQAKLVAPAPGADVLQEAFACALRAPDHRVLRPWRYLVIEGEDLEKLGELFVDVMRKGNPALDEQESERLRKMPLRAPMIVVAITSHKDDPKVPHEEQVLSTGAGIQNFLLALHARGFGSMWRTGPLAEHAGVKAGLGLSANESIAGFVYAGTATSEARKPALLPVGDFVSKWPA